MYPVQMLAEQKPILFLGESRDPWWPVLSCILELIFGRKSTKLTFFWQGPEIISTDRKGGVLTDTPSGDQMTPSPLLRLFSYTLLGTLFRQGRDTLFLFPSRKML